MPSHRTGDVNGSLSGRKLPLRHRHHERTAVFTHKRQAAGHGADEFLNAAAEAVEALAD